MHNRSDPQSHTLGEIHIDGTDSDAAASYRISVKNENMAEWRNEQIAYTIPDLICIINAESGEPLTNPNVMPGMQVAVLILPEPEQFTTERALSVFGPADLR